MTLRFAMTRAAGWGLALCLMTGSAAEATAGHRIPLVPEASRTARGGASAADRSRREDLLRWLKSEGTADHADPEEDTRPSDRALVTAHSPSGDTVVPSSPDHSPARCRST